MTLRPQAFQTPPLPSPRSSILDQRPGKAQDGETEKNQELLCVQKRETSGRLFRFPILYFTVAGTEHTLGV